MDDSSIDYKGLIENDLFKNDYIKLANQLRFVDLNQLLTTDEQQSDSNLLAFFISIVTRIIWIFKFRKKSIYFLFEIR